MLVRDPFRPFLPKRAFPAHLSSVELTFTLDRHQVVHRPLQRPSPPAKLAEMHPPRSVTTWHVPLLLALLCPWHAWPTSTAQELPEAALDPGPRAPDTVSGTQCVFSVHLLGQPTRVGNITVQTDVNPP